MPANLHWYGEPLQPNARVIIRTETPDYGKEAVIISHQGQQSDGANIYAAYDALRPKRTLWLSSNQFTVKCHA